jgi:hypothetical protein
VVLEPARISLTLGAAIVRCAACNTELRVRRSDASGEARDPEPSRYLDLVRIAALLSRN